MYRIHVILPVCRPDGPHGPNVLVGCAHCPAWHRMPRVILTAPKARDQLGRALQRAVLRPFAQNIHLATRLGRLARRRVPHAGGAAGLVCAELRPQRAGTQRLQTPDSEGVGAQA